MIHMTHPGVAGVSLATLEAFEQVWELLGWVLVDPGDTGSELPADVSYSGEWVPATYEAGDMVSVSGVFYVASQLGVNKPPATSPGYWDVVGGVGGGGSANWGGIGGTLSAQTDLATALTAKLATAGHTAESIPAAVGGTSLADLVVPASRILGRKATGSLGPLTVAEVLTLLAVYTSAQTDSAIAVAIANLVNSAPGSLDTLKELADALGADPNFATTITTLIGTKMAKASNLADLVSASAARTNLGLLTGAVNNKVGAGSAGVLDATDATTTNARTPTTHATSHKIGGSDPITLSELGLPTASVAFNAQRATGGADPQSPQDFATKAYVDNSLSALPNKPVCQYGTAAALPANTYANGSSGVGATLTGNSNGPLMVDGQLVAPGLRILVQNEATWSRNGTYSVTQSGTVGLSPYILTRTTDFDQAAELGVAAVVPVDAEGLTPGSTNDGKMFISITSSPFIVGTTSITFTPIGSTYSASGGIQLSGTQFSLVDQAAKLGVAANLSDIASTATARTNLGLGTAAVANRVAAGASGVLDATDSTTTNARTPTSHAATHAPIRVVTDGVLNSTTTVTSATALFGADDVGRGITGTGIPGGTTIASVTNITTVILSAAATATGSGVTLTITPSDPLDQTRAHPTFTLASRPAAAATNAGQLIFVNDLNGGTIQKSTGSAWASVAPGINEKASDSSKINGVAVTGAPTFGQVLTATGTTAADWETPTGGGGSLTVQDENGTVASGVTQIDFQGAGITAASGSGEVVVTVPGGSGGSAHVIEEEGTPLTARSKLNFIGAGVTATDNAGADSTDVTIVAAGWEELGSSALGANAASISLTGLSARDELMIIVRLIGFDVADRACLRFNNDSGANYQTRLLTCATGAAALVNQENVSQTLFHVTPAAATGSKQATITIGNLLANVKVASVVLGQVAATVGTASAGVIHFGGGWFNTSAQVTRVDLVSAAGNNFLTGTGLKVFGRNI